MEYKPKAFNSPIIRIAKFGHVSNDSYEADLERAEYFDQVRTNLTLDLPLRNGCSLRELDTVNNCFGLRSLSESMLVNSIGVSAVVGFRREHEWFFFGKVRQTGDAINENMLASTSGVAEYARGQRIKELVAFAQSEMLREFYNERGLSVKNVIRIENLAFARELNRGGKPQFFFFIEIEPILPADFQQQFSRSLEGLNEFYDNWYTEISAHGKQLSPEYAFNLLLAFKVLTRDSSSLRSELQLDGVIV